MRYFLFALFAFFSPAPLAANFNWTVLPGSSPQSAYVGEAFPNPIRIAVTDEAGRPVPNPLIAFGQPYPDYIQFDAYCVIDLGYACDAQGDANGIVTLHARARGKVGEHVIWLGGKVRLTVLDRTEIPKVRLLWWGGDAQSGWGVAIPQRGSSIFPVYFAYDTFGHPRWSVLEGDWNAGFGSSFQGTLNEYRGSPYYAFDTTKVRVARSSASALRLDPLRSSGDFTVQPDSTLITPPLSPVTLGLAPLDFSPVRDAVERGVADIWWGGPSQSGWGIAIAEDHGNLFMAWFTYGADGLPVWFSMSEGAWTSTDTWSGPIFRTTGSGAVGSGYDPKAFRAVTVGSFSIRFADANNALFSYSLEGHAGTLQLQRFDY